MARHLCLWTSAFLVLALSGASAALAAGSERAATPNVAYAKAQIAKFKQVPRFSAPGPAFDASKARGKTVFNIPISSAIPFIQTIDKAAESVAKRFGVEWIQFPNQGQPSQWVAGIEQAISRKVDVILLNGPDPRVLQPQLKKAKAAGISVIEGHLIDKGMPEPPNVDAFLYSPFLKAARLEADWAIADTGGKANVLIINSNEVYPSRFIVKAMLDELKAVCGSSCKVRVVNVPITDWATKIQSEVQSALVRDPGLNYVLPIYDSMSQFVVPGITAAGKTDRVHIATFNGTPFVMKMLQEGETVRMEVGESLDWLGWASMDMVLRKLAGVPLISDTTVIRVFDKTNIRQAGTPPKENIGYGRAYVDGYLKLWGAR